MSSRCTWVLSVLVALVVVLGSGIGFAMPSLLGGTGIVSVPNACVAPTGNVQAVVDYLRTENAQQAVSAINMYSGAPSLELQGQRRAGREGDGHVR